MTIIQKQVRNKDIGRFGYKPEAIVIHIAEGYLAGAYSWFNNPTSFVSSHYMIGKNTEIWQFVSDSDTAWHAGVVMNPTWRLLKPGVNPNFYTIGIEHEGFSGEVWQAPMADASAQLIAHLCQKHGIPLDRNHIIGHNEINTVNRANCPGRGINLNNLINLALKYYEDPAMIKELQAQIQKLNSQITSLNTQIKNIKSENAKLKEENAKLRVQLSEIFESEEFRKIEVLNAQLSKEIKALQESQKKQNDLINQLTLENQKLKEGLKSNSFSTLFGTIFDKMTRR